MIPKEKLAELVPGLKQKHGDDIHLVTAEEEQVIVRVPSQAEYQRFLDHAAEKAKRTRAHETLTRSCVVYPEAAEFDRLLERRPGIATVVGDKLTELAGAVEHVEVKKL